MFDTVNDGTYFGCFNMHGTFTLRRCHWTNANPPRAWETCRPISKLLRVRSRFLTFLTRMKLRKMLSSWSSTLNVNRVKSAMGLKPDHMAAMEEMEADNMDQNLGMENQDLSRGGFFSFFFTILSNFLYLKLVSVSTKIWVTIKKWTMRSILPWIMKAIDLKYGWENSLNRFSIKI